MLLFSLTARSLAFTDTFAMTRKLCDTRAHLFTQHTLIVVVNGKVYETNPLERRRSPHASTILVTSRM